MPKKTNKSLLTGFWALIFLAGLLWPHYGHAEQLNILEEESGTALPRNVENALSYLLNLIHQKNAAFEPSRVSPLIEFAALSGDDDTRQVAPAKRKSGSGACIRTDIHTSLERILRYAYNPNIPGFIVNPNVLRLSGWYPGSDILAENVKLWQALRDLKAPLVLRGKEYEVNTPDLFSGAYYEYDLQRLIVLMKHKGKNVLISVSKMPNPSGVGKKAVIINENNWDYFYSGIKGLALKIIGPMETYIYDSASVQIVSETNAAEPRTRLVLFKWLKAGWAEMNLVRRSHIYEGGRRYVQGLKEVMESGALPDPKVFAQRIQEIKALPEKDIEAKIDDYSRNFERIAKKNSDMTKKDYARIIEDGGYGKLLNQEERLGVLWLEYLKSKIGKTPLVQFDFPPLKKNVLAETGLDVSTHATGPL